MAAWLVPLSSASLVKTVDRSDSYTFLHCSNDAAGGGGSSSSAEAELMRSKAILNAGSCVLYDEETLAMDTAVDVENKSRSVKIGIEYQE